MEESANVRKETASHAAVIFLFMVIVAQLLYVCLCFKYERKGIFSDEIWCYGLANSNYKPFIYAPDGFRANYIDEHDLYDNFNEPVSGSELRDYITVQKGQRFDYGSVYHNQTLDCHPILYYALLHTVCSFFPDTFSLFFAFVPSLIFLCLTQIFLFRLTFEITGSEWRALAVCVFYAAVPASLFTFIFLRMYSLLTMLLVMNTYYTARLICSGEGEMTAKNLLPVFITAFLAFNTQYSAVAYIGFMTAVVCVYLLFRKGLRAAAGYGLLMAGTLLLFAAVFPAFVEHITNNQFTGEKRYDLSTQLRAVVGYITKYSLGFHVGLVRSSKIYYCIAAVVLTAAFAAPVLFLARNTAPVKKLLGAAKRGGKSLAEKLKTAHYVPLMIFAGVCGIVVFVDLSCDIAYTLDGSVRYLMPCYPFVCLLAAVVVCGLAKVLPLIRKVPLVLFIALAAAACVRSNMEDRSVFMYDTFPTTVTEAADMLEGTKDVVVIPERRFIMTNTCAYLYKCDSAYFVLAGELKNDGQRVISSFGRPDRVWVEKDNYFLTERQRDSLVAKGFITEEQKKAFKLRSELEEDTEHEVFPDGVRERIIDEEADLLTGSDPDIEFAVEANGRLFLILKCRKSI